jgi:hypothetical protein
MLHRRRRAARAAVRGRLQLRGGRNGVRHGRLQALRRLGPPHSARSRRRHVRAQVRAPRSCKPRLFPRAVLQFQLTLGCSGGRMFTAAKIVNAPQPASHVAITAVAQVTGEGAQYFPLQRLSVCVPPPPPPLPSNSRCCSYGDALRSLSSSVAGYGHFFSGPFPAQCRRVPRRVWLCRVTLQQHQQQRVLPARVHARAIVLPAAHPQLQPAAPGQPRAPSFTQHRSLATHAFAAPTFSLCRVSFSPALRLQRRSRTHATRTPVLNPKP